MPKNAYQKIGIATVIMMASIFLSRVIGYFREMTIAAVAGANASVDAYRVAFVLPEILNHILASGFLSVTFIPIFSKYLAADDEAGAWNIFSIILTVFGALLAVLIILSMVLTPQIVPLLAMGREDPEFLMNTVRMTRIILPAQIFFFAGSLLMAVQFAKEQFWIPALAPIIYNLGIICGGWLLGPWIGVEGFSWGALIGALIGNLLVQLIGALKVGLSFKLNVNIFHKDLRQYILLTLPLMFGLTMVFSMEIFSKFFGSYLPEGSIAWLDFGKTVMMMLVAFFGQAIGVASFPYLSRLAAENRWNEMNRMFNTLLRQLVTLIIPTSILMFVLRYEIVRVLFERGDFLPKDTDMTVTALSGLLVGAVAISAMTVVNRGFYAMQNTFLPTVYSTAAVIVSIPIYWIGLKMYGLIGVALAMSASAFIQAGVLFFMWNRRSHNTESVVVYAACGKTVLASLPLGIILWLTHRYLIQKIDPVTIYPSILVIAVVTLLFFLLMGLGGWLFNVQAVRHIGRRLHNILRLIINRQSASP